MDSEVDKRIENLEAKVRELDMNTLRPPLTSFAKQGLLNFFNTRIYIGGADSGGGAVFVVAPLGWSTTRLAAGQYRIYHNLGSTNFAVFIQPTGTSVFSSITSYTSSQIDFRIYDDTGALSDAAWNFLVVPYF